MGQGCPVGVRLCTGIVRAREGNQRKGGREAWREEWASHGCIRRAPSSRMTSPFIMGFSIIAFTRCAYSFG